MAHGPDTIRGRAAERRRHAMQALRAAGGEVVHSARVETCGALSALYVDVAGETIHRRVLDALARDGAVRKFRKAGGDVVWRLAPSSASARAG